MKTLKLTFLAALFLCSTSAFSSNKPENAIHEPNDSVSKQVVIANVQKNLYKWYPFHEMTTEYSDDLLVQCRINALNQVEILSIDGENELLEKEIQETLEKHPVVAPYGLHGHIIAFKVKLEVR